MRKNQIASNKPRPFDRGCREKVFVDRRFRTSKLFETYITSNFYNIIKGDKLNLIFGLVEIQGESKNGLLFCDDRSF